MNLEAFTVEYLPKLQILIFEFEIWCDWLKLGILFKFSKFSKDRTSLLSRNSKFYNTRQC